MISSMGGYRCCHIQFWNMVIMEKEKRYVASISGGKDSMAMVLGLMEKGWPLTHCVYFDTGMEFSCIRKNIEKVRLELEQYGCELVILQPERHFLEEMLLRRIKCRDGSSQPYPVLEYGDYGKRKTICCLHLRRKGLHGNGFRAYGKGLAVNALRLF